MAKAIIIESSLKTRSINQYSFSIFKLRFKTKKTKIKEVLPFRVKFINLGITSNYGPGNAAPIGIAIIGLNNYVM